MLVRMDDTRFPLRVGVVILPDMHWHEAGPLWRRAEDLGFAHAWTYDHLTWRGHRDETWFGATPTLTAAALSTRRIRLGPLVASPNFRHPLPFAKELVTLDDISQGRLVVGLGAGGTGWDATMLGHDAWSRGERVARFAEFVTLTDLLLRETASSYTGRYYSTADARTYPGCVQEPRAPFAIAAEGNATMRIAARYGQAWVTTGGGEGTGLGPREGAAIVRAQINRLADACEAAGRDSSSVDRLVLTGLSLDGCLGSFDEFVDGAGHYADAGATDLIVHWPRPTAPFHGDVTTFERIFAP
jgi:alkanesulfonate monooxygenase SsuD/methylene tetrahydromethanopterin reductase-like flavin-dependent oxidoreductase (luciferase family)